MLHVGLALAAGGPDAGGSIYVLRFTGVVCAKAPCPVWEAVEVSTCKRVTADSIDVVGAPDAKYSNDQLESWLGEHSATVRGLAEAYPDSDAIMFRIFEILGDPDPQTASCAPDVSE